MLRTSLIGLLLLFESALDAEPEISVERNVAVPMSDGTVLRANVFRPSVGGPFPVLLWRTPYGKADSGYEQLVRSGFIVVVQDARGRYASDGEFESFVRFNTHDGSDGQDTVEWASRLPNSTGKVGLFGTSYPGFLAWRAAGQKPKSLAAMAAFSIPASYLDLEGPGTIRPGRRLKWWYGTMAPDMFRRQNQEPLVGSQRALNAATQWENEDGARLLNFLPWSDLPENVFVSERPHVQAWLREPWRDPWHLEKDASKTSVPNLNVCGWYDHCNGSIDLHRAISSSGATFEAKRHSRLIVGPWSHSGLGKRQQGDLDFGPAAQVDLTELYVQWFGKWLRKDNNDVSRWAPVRLFVMGANEWRDFYEWPPKYASPRDWHLDSNGQANTPSGDGRLTRDPPARDTHDEYDYDPHSPVPTLWTKSLFTIPADQRPLNERRDILVYQTAPLTEFVETIGYPDVVLMASSNQPDTDFFVRLIDVAPDGRSTDVTSGLVRARYRDAYPNAWAVEKSRLLVANEVTSFRIRMRPTAHRFLPGHRIRLDITSSDFPNYDRNHNTAADQNSNAELITARQSVFHGPSYRSRLSLPVMRQKGTVPIWAEGVTQLPAPKFIREFGKLGEQAGELHSPIGIAIDGEDHIYISEFANKRIQVFTSLGESRRIISLPSQPGGIAVDKAGRIYVALMLAHEVQVFDGEGRHLSTWGKSGSGDGEFNQPGGVTIGPDGLVYVVDQNNHRIQRFTVEGKFAGKWGEFGSGPGQFGGEGPKGSRLSGPHFCAFDLTGHLYTTEGANLRVQRFNGEGKFVGEWLGVGESAGGFGGRPKDRTNPFEGPIGVTVDAQGRIWVSATNNRVQCFSVEGQFLTGIGDEGNGPGEFIIPHAMAIDSAGLLYVVDSSNQRIQVFEVP